MGQAVVLIARRTFWEPVQGIAELITEIAEAERGRFVLWLPVFMGFGVLVYFGLHAEPPAWIGAVCAAPLVGVAWFMRPPVPRAIVLAACFGALGFASAQHATWHLPPLEPDLPTRAVVVTGLVRTVESLPGARRVTLVEVALREAASPEGNAPVRRLTRSVRIRLHAGDDGAIETGDTVRVRAMARAPLPPALPGGWDTQRDAFFAGLGASGYALGRVAIVAHGGPDRFSAYVQWLREAIAARVSAAVPGAAGALCVTLLTGASRGIPEADHDAFRASGLAHLLAVAGLHIGIVMGFGFAVARSSLALSEWASLFWPAKQIAALCALALGGFYLLLTGAHVPIVRSFAMACLYTLAVIVGRQAISVRALGLAGIALMATSPYEVPGVSFQMSFSAVLALISGFETLRPWLRGLQGKSAVRRLLSYVTALALTSTLAGTASLPYAAYHFGRVQIYYILSNLFAVPLAAFWVMPAGMIALALMPLHLEWLALVPMGWGADLIIGIARLTAAMPRATIAVPHIQSWGLGVLSFGIAWIGIWRSRIRLLGVAAIAVGVASPVFDQPPDILLSGDAGLIGFRTENGVFLQQSRGGENFTRDAWITRWGAGAAASLPDDGEAAFTCRGDTCLFRPRIDTAAALLVRGPAKQADCAGVAVVVSAEPARAACAWPRPPLADRFTVWRDGPVAIWLGPHGARILSDRAERGDRPWVPPPPRPRPRPVPDLPVAPLDDQ